MRTKSQPRAVCDAGPIIHLDELDCLYLLDDFNEVILPEAVCDEINRHRIAALSKFKFSLASVSGSEYVNPVLPTMCRLFSLGFGETEALFLMERNPEALFFTDDASARLVATQMRFKVHGTIGILIRSMRRRQMEPLQVLNLLSEIPTKSTLHIKRSLLEEIRTKIKNKFSL